MGWSAAVGSEPSEPWHVRCFFPLLRNLLFTSSLSPLHIQRVSSVQHGRPLHSAGHAEVSGGHRSAAATGRSPWWARCAAHAPDAATKPVDEADRFPAVSAESGGQMSSASVAGGRAGRGGRLSSGTNLVEGDPWHRSSALLLAPTPANPGAPTASLGAGPLALESVCCARKACCARQLTLPGLSAAGRGPSGGAHVAPIASPRRGRPGARPGRAAAAIRNVPSRSQTELARCGADGRGLCPLEVWCCYCRSVGCIS